MPTLIRTIYYINWWPHLQQLFVIIMKLIFHVLGATLVAALNVPSAPATGKLTVIVFSDGQCNRGGSSWEYAPGCYLLNGYQSLHVNGAPGLRRE